MMEMFVTLQVPYTAPLAAALGASAAPPAQTPPAFGAA